MYKTTEYKAVTLSISEYRNKVKEQALRLVAEFENKSLNAVNLQLSEYATDLSKRANIRCSFLLDIREYIKENLQKEVKQVEVMRLRHGITDDETPLEYSIEQAQREFSRSIQRYVKLDQSNAVIPDEDGVRKIVLRLIIPSK